MDKLRESVLAAVTENMGGLELQAINNLIDDSKQLEIAREYQAAAEQKTKDAERDLRNSRQQLDQAEKRAADRLAEINELKKTIEIMKERDFEAQVANQINRVLAQDKEELFGILSGAYRHYTQTTTRTEQVMADGGEFMGMDNMGQSVPMKAMQTKEDLTQTTITKTE